MFPVLPHLLHEIHTECFKAAEQWKESGFLISQDRTASVKGAPEVSRGLWRICLVYHKLLLRSGALWRCRSLPFWEQQ